MGVIPERETLSLASLLPKELESYKRSLTEDENDIASDDSEWEVDVDEDTNDDIEMAVALLIYLKISEKYSFFLVVNILYEHC